MQRELSYTELKNGCSADDFSFCSTTELEPLEGIIGQDRACLLYTSPSPRDRG